MTIEQKRAAFEAWSHGRCELHLVNPAGRYSSTITQFAWEAYQAGRAAQEDSEDKWRDLALQFDGHRMQALAWLKQILAELPADAWPFARTFLKSPPMSGEAVLAERIEELAALQSHDAERYRWLITKLQQVYDGDYFDCFETGSMSFYCHMLGQFKGDRVVRAEITWRDKTDEPIGLSEAIDQARCIEGEG